MNMQTDKRWPRVAELLTEQLGCERESVKPEAKLVEDLGADSLDGVETLMSFEEEYDIEIDPLELRSLLLVEPMADTNLVEMAAQGTQDRLLPVVVDTWIDVYLDIRAQDIEETRSNTLSVVQGELDGLSVKIEQAREPKTTTTVKVAPDTVQVRRAFDFGDEGLPLEELLDPVESSRSARSIGDRSFEEQRKTGRNEPCPCGSGKKFKKCCARKPR